MALSLPFVVVAIGAVVTLAIGAHQAIAGLVHVYGVGRGEIVVVVVHVGPARGEEGVRARAQSRDANQRLAVLVGRRRRAGPVAGRREYAVAVGGHAARGPDPLALPARR